MAEEHNNHPSTDTNTVLLVILIIAVVAFGLYFLLRAERPAPEEQKEGVEFRFEVDKQP